MKVHLRDETNAGGVLCGKAFWHDVYYTRDLHQVTCKNCWRCLAGIVNLVPTTPPEIICDRLQELGHARTVLTFRWNPHGKAP